MKRNQKEKRKTAFKMAVIVTIVLLILTLVIIFQKLRVFQSLFYPRSPEKLLSKVIQISSQSLKNPKKCLQLTNYLDAKTQLLSADPLFLPELCRSIASYNGLPIFQYDVLEVKNAASHDDFKAVLVRIDYGNGKKQYSRIKTFYVKKEKNRWKLTSLLTL